MFLTPRLLFIKDLSVCNLSAEVLMVHCSFMQSAMFFFFCCSLQIYLCIQLLDFLNLFDSLVHYFKYVVHNVHFYRTEYSKIHRYPHQTLLVVR